MTHFVSCEHSRMYTNKRLKLPWTITLDDVDKYRMLTFDCLLFMI